MGRFRIKDYREPRAPRTDAQRAQSQRAFFLFRLRGLWSLAWIIPNKRRRAIILALIDDEIEAQGGERQAERRRREYLSWNVPESEIPF